MRFALFFAAAALLAQNWGTRAPRVISRTNPRYTEEARRAHVNSAVGVTLVVREDGVPYDIRVVRGAGFGLDEAAVQAIQTWRFEAGSKGGALQAIPARVEVGFRIDDQARSGQIARLSFTLPPGMERPVLLSGAMPENPADTAAVSVRLRFTVGADGTIHGLQTLDSDNREWEDHVLEQVAHWRFQPAASNGVPQDAGGVFELSVVPQPSENRPSQHRIQTTIWPPEPQDTSLPAPILVSPPDRAIFDSYPRQIHCKWFASPAAASYLLEWDYMVQDDWNAELHGIPGTALPANDTEATLEFVGAQPGRWRVWPVNIYGRRGNPSEWRTFRYLR